MFSNRYFPISNPSNMNHSVHAQLQSAAQGAREPHNTLLFFLAHHTLPHHRIVPAQQGQRTHQKRPRFSHSVWLYSSACWIIVNTRSRDQIYSTLTHSHLLAWNVASFPGFQTRTRDRESYIYLLCLFGFVISCHGDCGGKDVRCTPSGMVWSI